MKGGNDVPPPVATFLLTCWKNGEAIVEQQKATGTNTIQLVDTVSDGIYEMLRRQLPGIRIVQVIHVMDETTVAEAVKASQAVDAILLDSGNPKLAVKELGGTGRVHNWQISKQIRISY